MNLMKPIFVDLGLPLCSPNSVSWCSGFLNVGDRWGVLRETCDRMDGTVVRPSHNGERLSYGGLAG